MYLFFFMIKINLVGIYDLKLLVDKKVFIYFKIIIYFLRMIKGVCLLLVFIINVYGFGKYYFFFYCNWGD